MGEAVKAGKVKGTLLAREYSSAEGDPYYPVPNPANHALYEQYRELAEKEEGVCFVGRLASYKYFNMDQAILNALEIYDNMKETGKLAPLALALALTPTPTPTLTLALALAPTLTTSLTLTPTLT